MMKYFVKQPLLYGVKSVYHQQYYHVTDIAITYQQKNHLHHAMSTMRIITEWEKVIPKSHPDHLNVNGDNAVSYYPSNTDKSTPYMVGAAHPVSPYAVLTDNKNDIKATHDDEGAYLERKCVSSFGIPKLDVIVIDEINDIALVRHPHWSSNTFMTKEDYKIVNNGVKCDALSGYREETNDSDSNHFLNLY